MVSTLPTEARAPRGALVLALLFLAACGGGDGGGTGPAGSGRLSVTVSGLPGGAAARVTVTGPDNFHRSLAASAELKGLTEGAYRVSAGYVNAQGQTWTATPSPDSIFVAAHDTQSVAVAYVGGPATNLDLAVSGTQLVQSVQRSDGSVPMVATREALLRVFVAADTANTALPAVRVRLFQGGTQVDSIDVPAPASSVPLLPDTTALARSWNVLIPANRMQTGLAYQVEVDPDDAVSETDEANNRWPGPAATQTVTVQAVPALTIKLVPVAQVASGLKGDVTLGTKDQFTETTKRIFPLAAVTTSLHGTYTSTSPAYQSSDGNGGWSQTLSEMSALRASEGGTANYVGIIQVTYGSGIAGLGYVGGPASVAWDKPGSAPGVIAHELGHNFGRLHAPCGNPSGPDQGYPYANAIIGVWGVDVTAMAYKGPAAYKDLMSYCNPEWVSDYTYLGVLAWRGTHPMVAGGPAGRGLLVWGRIQAGNVILEPAVVVDAPARLPQGGGPHRVEGLDAAGDPLFGLAFAGDPVPDLPRGAEEHFAFVVPLEAGMEGRLAQLRLVGHGLTAVRLPAAALRAGTTLPAVQAARARAGAPLQVAWDAGYPMAVVRDAATGEVLSFARGGAVTLPQAGGAVRVQLTDGVRALPEVTIGRP